MCTHAHMAYIRRETPASKIRGINEKKHGVWRFEKVMKIIGGGV